MFDLALGQSFCISLHILTASCNPDEMLVKLKRIVFFFLNIPLGLFKHSYWTETLWMPFVVQQSRELHRLHQTLTQVLALGKVVSLCTPGSGGMWTGLKNGLIVSCSCCVCLENCRPDYKSLVLVCCTPTWKSLLLIFPVLLPTLRHTVEGCSVCFLHLTHLTIGNTVSSVECLVQFGGGPCLTVWSSCGSCVAQIKHLHSTLLVLQTLPSILSQ